jgi:hypothetical protein
MDDQRFVVDLLYPGPDPYFPATIAVVVFRNIDKTSREEIGIDFKVFALEYADRRIDQFDEIMGQDLGCLPLLVRAEEGT